MQYFWILLLVLSSCGYRFSQGDLPSCYETISIPFVEGDPDGDLTTTLVKEIATSSRLRFKKSGGELILKVRIKDYNDKNVGYHYDTRTDGRLTKTLLPNETRTSILTEVRVIQAASGKTLLGPALISASMDFDYCRKCETVNEFSLGQYSDEDTAKDTVMHPLNQVLAQKIVEYIINSW